jgi:hypothetical protein
LLFGLRPRCSRVLDGLRSKPVRQPEAVVSSFECHSGTCDPVAFLFGLRPLAAQQFQQCAFVDRELLQWLALDERALMGWNAITPGASALRGAQGVWLAGWNLADGKGPAPVIQAEIADSGGVASIRAAPVRSAERYCS